MEAYKSIERSAPWRIKWALDAELNAGPNVRVKECTGCSNKEITYYS